MPTPGWTDFVSDFMEYTEGGFSAPLHRKWTAIAMVAGALERRVWVPLRNRDTYPNLYTWLVAKPGVGKQVINDGKALFEAAQSTGAPAFKLAPDSMTKASMIDALGRSKTSWLPTSGPAVEYSSMFIFAEEIGVMLPGYETDYIGVLNSVYGNPSAYKETRRTGSVREISIINPQFNVLAGVQPGWLQATLPVEAWNQGYTSRTIMVYETEQPPLDPFGQLEDTDHIQAKLTDRLSNMGRLYGAFAITPDAQERIRAWILSDCHPRPTISRLENYCRRRGQHGLKLMMASAVSRTCQLTIELIDVERALAWLLEVEVKMPDIFRAMEGRSDGQVIEELYDYLVGAWNLAGRKPIHDKAIYSFLSRKVPSEKVPKIIEVAERAGAITRMAGSDTYIPGTTYNRILE